MAETNELKNLEFQDNLKEKVDDEVDEGFGELDEKLFDYESELMDMFANEVAPKAKRLGKQLEVGRFAEIERFFVML